MKFNKICEINRLKFKQWLEFNFKQKMTWNNYGKVWNLDHIKPCASFDLTNESEVKECFSWKNTAPVYCKENLKKFSKIDKETIKYYETRVNEFEDPNTQMAMELYD